MSNKWTVDYDVVPTRPAMGFQMVGVAVSPSGKRYHLQQAIENFGQVLHSLRVVRTLYIVDDENEVTEEVDRLLEWFAH